jgi:hypothetical protein
LPLFEFPCVDSAKRRVSSPLIRRARSVPARGGVGITSAAPLLRDINHLRANLYSLATKGIEPAVLKKMVFGLRRMEALFLGIDHIAAGIG